MSLLWLEDHLPVKPLLSWPVYTNYRCEPLGTYITSCSSQSGLSLTDDQWAIFEILLGSTDDDVLNRHWVISIDNMDINRQCDPFSPFSSDILSDFSSIAAPDSSPMSISRLQTWIHLYGFPFDFTSPPKPVTENPIFYLDTLTAAARHIEFILFQAFKKKVFLAAHLLWRAKEIALVQQLFALYNADNLTISQMRHFRDLLEDTHECTEDLLYQTALRILRYRTTEHISNCKLTTQPERAEANAFLLKLHLEPPDMLTALWLKLYQNIYSNGLLILCEECKKPFTPKKETQRFCSDSCASKNRQQRYRDRKKALDSSPNITQNPAT